MVDGSVAATIPQICGARPYTYLSILLFSEQPVDLMCESENSTMLKPYRQKNQQGGGRSRGRSGDQGDGRIDGQGCQIGGQGSEVNVGVNGVLDFSTIIAQQLRNLLPTIVAQVGDQGRGQGNGRNQNGDAINDNIRGNVRNVIENNDRRGCTYKEFLACNPKEYDGKGGDVVYTRWIKKIGNGLIKKNLEKRGNEKEPSKDRNGRDDNKRNRTENAFATTTNPVRRERTGAVPKCTTCGAVPKCTTCNFHHPPETPCRICFNCNCPRHFTKDCRVMPMNVNPIIARNLAARACYECGSTDHVKAACPRLNQAQRQGKPSKPSYGC
nr:reverse transcriptase domain-containing protein [Tanacetum cinerariifolium]